VRPEHPGREIDADDAGAAARRDLSRDEPGARGDVEVDAVVSRRQRVDEPPPPAALEAE